MLQQTFTGLIPSSPAKKVLIVDDDIRNIFAMTSTHRAAPNAAPFAETGRGAIESLQGDPEIDIVLMDIMMPDMDGYDTMRAIRKLGKFPLPADHRPDRQSHERRPRKMHRSWRVRLYFETR